ncbi:MAG TPA: M56 family metallopeptidase [Bryobacteraceae bacterium]|nr:M56 family metallopeptidase [Bryobacteraceae bacterium]
MSWIGLGELFMRSALLLAAVEGVRQLLRPLSAKYRRAVVLAGFVLLAAFPVLSVLLPPLHFPLFTGPIRATVTVATGVATAYATPHGGARLSPMDWPLLIWLAGLLLALFPVLTGRLLVFRTIRQAAPLRDERWATLLKELADTVGLRRRPRLMVLSGAATPLAFGLLRPAILLPAESLDWTDARKRVVLLHELNHVRRRDGVWQLFASLMAAAWWFQPLVWMARRRLRQESEHACDEQVLATGVLPSEYATQLMEIARNNSSCLPSHAATCMARRSELEPRLVRILEPRSDARRIKRLIAAVVLISVVAVTAPAITFRKTRFSQGGSLMKRALVSSLLASATLSAATISGSLFDPTGVAIPDAKIVLHSAETSADLDATSGSDGKFSFSDLGAGQYILRVEKPGFADLLREFTVKQDSDIERGLQMQIGERQEQKAVNGNAPSRMAQPFAPDRIRVRGEVAQANLIRKVQPVYPAAAKAARVQGTVLLQVVILKDGTMGEITVAESPSSDLSQASLEAVRQWRYRPTLLNGQPIEVLTYVIINFTLSN